MGFKTDNIESLTGGPIDFPQGSTGATPLAWLGTWNGGIGYDVNQAVEFAGSSYLCIQANTGIIPYSDPAYWVVIASAGAQGAQGPDGPQGPTGPDGATGPQGSQGPDGPQGPQGPQGNETQPITGINNDGNGNLTIQTTNNSFGPYYLKGDTGATGSNGSNGSDGTVQLYSAGGSYPLSNSFGQNPVYLKGLNAGSNVSISDEGSALTINCTASQGPEGPQGPAGSNGSDGAQGPQGPTLNVYIDNALQGNYTEIYFYNGPGTSSGNQIYLG